MKPLKGYLTKKITFVQVGTTKVNDATTHLKRVCKYSDVPTENGWVLDRIYYPLPYDLMHVSVEGAKKDLSGWWNGMEWEGLRLKQGHKVVKWKRYMDYD